MRIVQGVLKTDEGIMDLGRSVGGVVFRGDFGCPGGLADLEISCHGRPFGLI